MVKILVTLSQLHPIWMASGMIKLNVDAGFDPNKRVHDMLVWASLLEIIWVKSFFHVGPVTTYTIQLKKLNV